MEGKSQLWDAARALTLGPPGSGEPGGPSRRPIIHSAIESDMSLFDPRKIRTRLSRALTRLVTLYYRKVWGMNIGVGTKISSLAKLDKTNPKGVNIGRYSYVTFGCAVLSHDMCRRIHLDTHIGDNCFIGCHSVIMPGVTIGDNCVIGAGSVVTRDIPPRSIAAGNPARVIRRNIATSAWGVLIDNGDPAVDDDAKRARCGCDAR